MRAFYQKGYDPDWVHKLGSGKATLNDRLAQGIAEQEYSLLDRKGSKQHAALWVILHFSCRGATQIFSNIPIVKDLLVIPMCEVKSADIDIIEDLK